MLLKQDASDKAYYGMNKLNGNYMHIYAHHRHKRKHVCMSLNLHSPFFRRLCKFFDKKVFSESLSMKSSS